MLGQCLTEITTSYGLPISLFLGGLVGGFSHCAWMCAPFVLAQSEGRADIHKLKSALLLPYHLGRMTTYVVLAILVSSVINLAFVFSDLKALISAPLLMLAGVVFLVTAFPRLSTVFPWASKLQMAVPYQWISRPISKLSRHSHFMARYGLGVLLGFMPCGLVVSALMASATASNVWAAGMAMAAFTVGTVPALLMVSFGGQAFKQKYPKVSWYVSRGGMVVSSFWLFMLAGTMVF